MLWRPTSLLPLLLLTPLGLRGAPVALSKTKQLHWPSHRRWGRCKIRNRFSSSHGTRTRDWGAGTLGAGAWWVHMAQPHCAPSPDHHLHPWNSHSFTRTDQKARGKRPILSLEAAAANLSLQTAVCRHQLCGLWFAFCCCLGVCLVLGLNKVQR